MDDGIAITLSLFDVNHESSVCVMMMMMMMMKSSRGGGWSRRQSEVGIGMISSGVLSRHLLLIYPRRYDIVVEAEASWWSTWWKDE